MGIRVEEEACYKMVTSSTSTFGLVSSVESTVPSFSTSHFAEETTSISTFSAQVTMPLCLQTKMPSTLKPKPFPTLTRSEDDEHDDASTATTATNVTLTTFDENDGCDFGNGSREEEAFEEALGDLTDRAALLSARESSPDYSVSDYVARRRASPPSTVQESIPLSPKSPQLMPPDETCRSKMMEWSYLILDRSFPLPPGASHRCRHRPSRRRYSDEALTIVLRAFSHVDRFASRIDVADRPGYKLLSMVCLHIAAKSSGLFASSSSRSSTLVKLERRIRPRAPSTGTSAVSDLSSNDDVDGFSAFRPALGLLSVNGLVAMSRGEFQRNHILKMESMVLSTLMWNLHPILPTEWLEMLLELAALTGMNSCRDSDGKPMTEEAIRRASLCQIERASEDYVLAVFVSPSILALAAFLNVVSSDDDGIDGRSMRTVIAEADRFDEEEFLEQVECVMGLRAHGTEDNLTGARKALLCFLDEDCTGSDEA